MPVPTTPAAWKRFVTDDNPEAKIIVADPGRPYPDDQPVVTETHWIMPARWLRPMFDYYQTEPAPGVWSPNGGKSLELQSADVPTERIGELLDPAGYSRTLVPVLVDQATAYTRTPTGVCVALYRDPDQALVGVRADYLDVATGDGRPDQLPTPYGYRFENTPAELRQLEGGTLKPVGVFLDRVHVHDGHYGPVSAESPTPTRWIPKWEEPEGRKLAAVVLPYRVP